MTRESVHLLERYRINLVVDLQHARSAKFGRSVICEEGPRLSMTVKETHIKAVEVLSVPEQDVDELVRVDIFSNHDVAVVNCIGGRGRRCVSRRSPARAERK